MAHKLWILAALTGASALAACGEEHATPRPGQGAAGIVEAPAVQAAGPAPEDGLAEQTPDYGAVGGSPDMALSDKGNPPNGSHNGE
ncbi:MAG TPA: hypothetical protein VF138_11300 [Caulobacteraceae bacterium]